MKKVMGVVLVLVLAALSVPVINLVVGGPKDTQVTKKAAANPEVKEVATLLEGKCANCHTQEPSLPFYASIPPASTLIQVDMKRGYRAFDLVGALTPAEGAPPNEAGLAWLEEGLDEGEMPPPQYVALHWDSTLSQAESDKVHAWIRDMRRKHFAPAGVSDAVAGAVVHPLPDKVEYDAAKAALGRKLYHDNRLSGDGTLSCATCHDLTKGGTDQAAVSTGIRGQKGGINAPTTFNAVFHHVQFWDGRAADLQAQAGGPPLNPVEMGATWEGIVAALTADPAFMTEFTAVYPEGPNEKTITDAIAHFERTLVTPGSPFDRYLMGDKTALSADAQKGWELFQGMGCASCHVGKALGGQSFEIMGLEADYFATRKAPATDADKGRFNVTQDPRDMGRFKVPTLRNVALTWPYFHDASAADLASATRVMAQIQTGDALSEADTKALVAFLESLTGTWEGKSL